MTQFGFTWLHVNLLAVKLPFPFRNCVRASILTLRLGSLRCHGVYLQSAHQEGKQLGSRSNRLRLEAVALLGFIPLCQVAECNFFANAFSSSIPSCCKLVFTFFFDARLGMTLGLAFRAVERVRALALAFALAFGALVVVLGFRLEAALDFGSGVGSGFAAHGVDSNSVGVSFSSELSHSRVGPGEQGAGVAGSAGWRVGSGVSGGAAAADAAASMISSSVL